MQNALRQLREEEGLVFDVQFLRHPFFLREPNQETGASPNPYVPKPEQKEPSPQPKQAAAKKDPPPPNPIAFMMGNLNKIFKAAGLSEKFPAQAGDSMDSQRLVWYAFEKEGPEKGELFWDRLAERFEEGLNTKIRPIRLDNHALLLESALAAGLDAAETNRVLNSDVYRQEVLGAFNLVMDHGVDSIPLWIFEVDGVAQGEWLKTPDGIGREFLHGSSTQATYREIFLKLHADCTAQVATSARL